MHTEGVCTHNREISKPDSDPRPLLVTAITCSRLEGCCLQEKSTPRLHLCHHVHRVLRAGTESCSFRCKTARLLPLQGLASAPAPPETTGSCSQAQQETGETYTEILLSPLRPTPGALKNPFIAIATPSHLPLFS